jgi:toxin FitB
VYGAWLDTVMCDYAGRNLSVDIEATDEWGRLSLPDPIPVVDGLMAAAAKVRGMNTTKMLYTETDDTAVHG